MSEHATSVEAVSAAVDSSVAHTDNATAEGDSSSAVATAGESNGVPATGSKEELLVAEATKGTFRRDRCSSLCDNAS